MLVNNMAFLKYIVTKKISSFIIKNLNYFAFLVRILVNFSFFFIHSFTNITLLTQLLFNTQRVLNIALLFIKTTNRIFLTLKALNCLLFLAPSACFLLNNSSKGFNALTFIKKRQGGRLLCVLI